MCTPKRGLRLLATTFTICIVLPLPLIPSGCVQDAHLLFPSLTASARDPTSQPTCRPGRRVHVVDCGRQSIRRIGTRYGAPSPSGNVTTYGNGYLLDPQEDLARV